MRTSVLHRMLRYQVRRDAVDAARAAAAALADEVGRKEGGTASYRAFQEAADATRFVHVMSFRTPSAEKYHDGTAWQKRFRDVVRPLCMEPPATVALASLGAE